ncbi:uncharacterized protein [Palaemon carinicauda]|uniref:uncharacterized protein n=1 Tax=Palaemon carinicauda TaxID=392227 RepID=UPI0035B5FB5B
MERKVLFTGVILAMAIAVTTGEGLARPSDNITPSHATEEDDGDPFVASGSTHKSRLIRNSHQLGEETFGSAYQRAAAEEESRSALEDTHQLSGDSGGDADEAYLLSESNARQVRQRSGGRRRRPLDPERRRQLQLRRQKLGLPIRKFSRDKEDDHHQETQTDSSLTPDLMDDTAVLVATPGPKMVRVFPDVFTTTESPSTTPTTASTTSRFPSFSAASRLRQRFKTIRDEWGLRTDVKEEEVIEQPSVKEPRNRVTSRARVVTASTRGINRNDKRLRYRPILVRKKLRSKVKVTSPSPAYPAVNPPVLEPVPVDYEEEEGSDEFETQSYDTFSEEPTVQETFHTEPYYFSTEPSIYEPVTKPRHTPVPKKVALEIPTQRPKKHFQEPNAGVSEASFLKPKTSFQLGERTEPKGLTPVPLGPELTPTTTPNYFSEVPHFTEPSRFPGLDQTSEPVFISEPAYEVDPSYGRDPAYLPAPDHTFDYPQEPAYAQEQFFAEEPIYDLNYDTSEEYSSEEYEDKPGIKDVSYIEITSRKSSFTIKTINKHRSSIVQQ